MFPVECIDIVWMMGPLHIEMVFLNVLGYWLNDSGWCTIFEKSKVSIAGKIESFVKGNHVKRSRYAHQISLASLVKLAKIAFDKQTEDTSYNDWKNNLSMKCATANYWFTVIDLEKKLFMFVRSLREAKFHLFVRCVDDLIPWLFALDHVNYARWLPVFLHDLKQLPAQNNIFEEFSRGYFTIKKSDHVFSNMGMDQAHERNNKIIKTDGGVIGIIDNEQALLEWAVAGPQIVDMLQDVYAFDEENDEGFRHHREDTDAFESKSREDRDKLFNAFLEFGNPFEEEGSYLIHLTTKFLF